MLTLSGSWYTRIQSTRIFPGIGRSAEGSWNDGDIPKLMMRYIGSVGTGLGPMETRSSFARAALVTVHVGLLLLTHVMYEVSSVPG